MKLRFAAALFLALAACGGDPDSPPPASEATAPAPAEESGTLDAVLDSAAERFVKLALGLGEHDASFVDAYHGPAEWAEAAKAAPSSLDDLAAEAEALFVMLDDIPPERADARSTMLRRLVIAAETRIAMARGETFSFDEETRLLYDVVAPRYDLADFDAALAEVEALLPGDGPLNERVDAFRNSLAIPEDKLRFVFDAAIAECRRRTLEHIDLPENERFRLEFVTDKPWSGYNWYQGGYESLIQVNASLPIVIDRAVDLGCHEGYPGHHAWNMIIERDLLKGEGWIEYALYPLFSPLSLIAEGSGNFGIELAFPGDEKIAFERDVLFPLAGLDPSKAETLAHLNSLRDRLSHADNHVARDYLDGRIDRAEAVDLLMKYKLFDRRRAEQRVDFIETYRGYVVNYNLGRDLVAAHVRAKEGEGVDRWKAFEDLLTRPTAASDLTAGR